MKKILVLLLLTTAAGALTAAALTYNSDGSITFTSADGKTRHVNMDGKTPYGVVIEDERRIIRRRNFTLELVYAGSLSDDLKEGAIKTFFSELDAEFRHWIYKNKLPRKKVKILVSNCRFGKTGYCKRKSLRGITVYLFHKGKEVKAHILTRNEILSKKRRPFLAAEVVKNLMN